MKRTLLQLVIVLAIAAGAYVAWQALGEPEAREDSRGGGSGVVPVSIAEARVDRVVQRVESVGTTRAREAVEVVAPLAGRVAAIHFEEGEQVEQEQLLVELDSEREAAQLREAEALRDDVASQLSRANRLLQSQNVSRARVDELRAGLAAADARVAALQAALDDKEIRAPFDGVVGLREVSRGAFVQPQQRVTTLDDISSLRLDFAVPERFMGSLLPGLAVEATSAAFPDTPIMGRVTRIDTRVDSVTRSLRVQAELANEDRRLRPGMFMGVFLTVGEIEDAILVPEAALVNEGSDSYVFVIADDRAEQRAVTVGQRLHGEVEIRDGLAPGEAVAVLGLQRLGDGMEVRIVDEDERAPGAAAGV